MLAEMMAKAGLSRGNVSMQDEALVSEKWDSIYSSALSIFDTPHTSSMGCSPRKETVELLTPFFKARLASQDPVEVWSELSAVFK